MLFHYYAREKNWQTNTCNFQVLYNLEKKDQSALNYSVFLLLSEFPLLLYVKNIFVKNSIWLHFHRCVFIYFPIFLLAFFKKSFFFFFFLILELCEREELAWLIKEEVVLQSLFQISGFLRSYSTKIWQTFMDMLQQE